LTPSQQAPALESKKKTLQLERSASQNDEHCTLKVSKLVLEEWGWDRGN